jgi:hypothetical protein
MLTAKVRVVSAFALVAALSACNRNGGDLLLTPAPAPSAAPPAVSPLRDMLVPDPSALGDGGAAAPSPEAQPTPTPSPTPAQAQQQPSPAQPPQPGQGERVHVAHVLISHTDSIMRMPTITRTKDQARAFAATILQRARSGEDFIALARQHSDEPGHEGKGGDLGFITRGQTVEPFERASFALAVGAISDVVETQFGFHIIKRVE